MAHHDLVIGSYPVAFNTKVDSASATKPPVYPGSKADPEKEKEPKELEAEYFKDREEIENRQRALGFDYDCTTKASDDEKKAKEILEIVRFNDEIAFYQGEPPLEGFGGQKHPRFSGDHFLTNVDVMEQTALFHIAKRMPKGSHLHVHFNSCLLPNVLLDVAESMENMFISSDKPLTSLTNFDTCEIQFQIIKLGDAENRARTLSDAQKGSNMFTEKYPIREGPNKQNEWVSYWMQYGEFRQQWKAKGIAKLYPHERFQDYKTWLESKIVYDPVEAHNPCQTAEG